MKRCLFASLLLMLTTMSATAGGILTNTNQSVLFLKNPARDAAIGLDGVYSNPAGVAFMPEGFHLGFNWQYAHQTRTITSTNPVFALGRKNDGKDVKTFEGVADASAKPIAIDFNPGFGGTMAGGKVPQMLRVDVVIAQAEPCTENLDELFAWKGNDNLASSIRNVLQELRPEGTPVYTYFIKTNEE
jgi:hypothetical protein